MMLSRTTNQPAMLGVGGQAMSEEAAKRAWLAQAEAASRPSWGAPQLAAPQPAAPQPAAQMMSEEAAKRAWLARAEAASRPSWSVTPEEAAKKAWLAKLDAPTWGNAATALANVASEAAHMAELEEECYKGDDVACDNLSREDQAKRAWLAKLDVPTWGAAAAAVSAVATQVMEMPELAPRMSEEEAKQAWLARTAPAWGAGRPQMS